MDVTSSAPYVKLDFHLVDCAFFSVQKLFGLPAGLGVAIVNAKCIDKAALLQAQGNSIGSYHNFLYLKEFATTFQTPTTPNVLAIYLLGQVTKQYLAHGIDTLRHETDEKAKTLYNFFGSQAGFSPAVKAAQFRSATVLSIETTKDTAQLRKGLSQSGFEVGAGYGKFKATQIRVANFPFHTAEQVKRLLKVVEKL